MQFASLHCKETKATSARNRRASITLLQLYNRSQLASFDQQIDWTLKREDSVVRDRSYLLFGSFLYTFSLMTDILRSRWQVSGKNTNLRYRDTPHCLALFTCHFGDCWKRALGPFSEIKSQQSCGSQQLRRQVMTGRMEIQRPFSGALEIID